MKTTTRVAVIGGGVVEGMQKGRSAPGFDGGRFSPAMDGPTHAFHRWVATGMRAALGG